MKIEKILTAILALFTMTTAWAQDAEKQLSLFEKQPTVKAANQFFDELLKVEFLDEKIAFPDDAPIDTLRQHVYYWAAEFFYDQQQYSTAEEYGLKALPLCQSASSRDLEGDCLNLLSVIYIRLADYEKAAKYANLCYELDKEEGNPDKISSSLNTLAAIYMSARQPKEAEKYVLKGIEYSQKADNPQRRAVLYGMASEVYHALGDEQKSYDNALLAYEIEVRLDQKKKIPIRQAQMASALIGLGRNDEAKTLLLQAIPAFRENGNRQSLGISCNQMGELLLNEHQNDSAARYFDEALQIFLIHKDLYNENRSRKGLYNALRETDIKLAMQHLERCNELKDSLYDSETGMLLSKYAAHYDNEQLQLENERERAAHRRNLAIAVVLALMFAGGIWLLMWRKHQKQLQHVRELTALIEKMAVSVEKTPMKPTENGYKDFLTATTNAIHKGLETGEIDVESIARKLCMSSATFRRRLQLATGETPATYILAVRMQKAHQMLEEDSFLSVSEIALKCGYDEIGSFSRAFKRVYGVPPSTKKKIL